MWFVQLAISSTPSLTRWTGNISTNRLRNRFFSSIKFIRFFPHQVCSLDSISLVEFVAVAVPGAVVTVGDKVHSSESTDMLSAVASLWITCSAG